MTIAADPPSAAPTPPAVTVGPDGMLTERAPLDAVSVLTAYSCTLLLMPSSLVVPALGAAGSPAGIFGIGLLAWWLVTRLVPGMCVPGPQPMRRFVGLLLIAVTLSYAAAQLRGMDGVEQRAADRGMLAILSLVGVALVAMDGITEIDRLTVLVRRLTYLGAAMGAIGELQNLFGLNLRSVYTLIPGLQFNNDYGFGFTTATVTRVASTAGHPIEFGVVMAILLPFALHRALFDKGEHPRRAWLVVGLIALGMPLSVSRSAIVGIVGAGLVLVIAWKPLRTRRAFWTLIGTLVVIRLIAPGTLGTLRSGFMNLGNDDSVTGRTEDYARVGRYISERPIFGRGFTTFLPDRYILLDNQYLGGLIEIGFFGMGSLVLMLGAGFVMAIIGARRYTDLRLRMLGPAFAATLLAALLAMGTFDAFGYSMFSSLLLMMCGLVGAYWRLSRPPVTD